jgi:protein TonB
VIARLGRLMLSVLLHAGLIALLLAWPVVDWTRPLFVDLGERAESPGSPTGESAAVRSARPAGRAAGPAAAPVRASARPEPPAPVASSVPATAPAPSPVAPAVPPAPPALAIAPEPVAEPAGTPAPAPPAVPPAPSGSSAVSASDRGSGAVAGGGAQILGDGDRASGGGGPGSSVARLTPGAGGSGAAPPEYGAYLRQFRQRVQESLIYPIAARRQGLGGTVELHVWLEATGRVRDVQVARSSSHRVLDDAAVEAIRRLGPVPFPESLPRRPLLVRIPLVYELR